jgi:hypothetical protein
VSVVQVAGEKSAPGACGSEINNPKRSDGSVSRFLGASERDMEIRPQYRLVPNM